MQNLQFPHGLNAQRFLAEYWQRTPLLLRQPLSGFQCNLDEDELAGMACDEAVESRLVLEKHGATPWEARYGPFNEEDFSDLPESHWTLLVQDVDKHLPEIAKLLDYFRFLPDWRLDDVMVSYAVDQGSVGPHIDDYDVFLYQAKGRRRWKIDTRPVSEDDYIPGLDLRILPQFETEQEWLLEPGDILYLPPNVAHWGIAEGECMTCSVGFRAPTLREMATAWFESALEKCIPEGRYRDPSLKPQSSPGEILPTSLDEFKTSLENCLKSGQQNDRWFGRFVTETKEDLQIYPRSDPLTDKAFLNRFMEKAVIHRHNYARMAFSRSENDGYDTLFVNGQHYRLASDSGDFLPVITHYRMLHFGYLQAWLEQPIYLSLLCRLYNDGYLQFSDDTG
jgi:50S ribosomal protein L16 3-hydroxylase